MKKRWLTKVMAFFMSVLLVLGTGSVQSYAFDENETEMQKGFYLTSEIPWMGQNYGGFYVLGIRTDATGQQISENSYYVSSYDEAYVEYAQGETVELVIENNESDWLPEDLKDDDVQTIIYTVDGVKQAPVRVLSDGRYHILIDTNTINPERIKLYWSEYQYTFDNITSVQGFDEETQTLIETLNNGYYYTVAITKDGENICTSWAGRERYIVSDNDIVTYTITYPMNSYFCNISVQNGIGQYFLNDGEFVSGPDGNDGESPFTLVSNNNMEMVVTANISKLRELYGDKIYGGRISVGFDFQRNDGPPVPDFPEIPDYPAQPTFSVDYQDSNGVLIKNYDNLDDLLSDFSKENSTTPKKGTLWFSSAIDLSDNTLYIGKDDEITIFPGYTSLLGDATAVHNDGKLTLYGGSIYSWAEGSCSIENHGELKMSYSSYASSVKNMEDGTLLVDAGRVGSLYNYGGSVKLMIADVDYVYNENGPVSELLHPGYAYMDYDYLNDIYLEVIDLSDVNEYTGPMKVTCVCKHVFDKMDPTVPGACYQEADCMNNTAYRYVCSICNQIGYGGIYEIPNSKLSHADSNNDGYCDTCANAFGVVLATFVDKEGNVKEITDICDLIDMFTEEKYMEGNTPSGTLNIVKSLNLCDNTLWTTKDCSLIVNAGNCVISGYNDIFMNYGKLHIMSGRFEMGSYNMGEMILEKDVEFETWGQCVTNGWWGYNISTLIVNGAHLVAYGDFVTENVGEIYINEGSRLEAVGDYNGVIRNQNKLEIKNAVLSSQYNNAIWSAGNNTKTIISDNSKITGRLTNCQNATMVISDSEVISLNDEPALINEDALLKITSAKLDGILSRDGESLDTFAVDGAKYYDENGAELSMTDVSEYAGKVVVKACEHIDANSDGKCDICDNWMDKLDVTLGGYRLILKDNIGVMFYLSIADSVLNAEGATLKIKNPNGTSETKLLKDVVKLDEKGSGYYTVECDVAAKEMTGIVQIQVVLPNGQASDEFEYTVQDYARYILTNDDEYSDEIELVTAMVNYGTCAQQYFDFNTKAMANCMLSEDEKHSVNIDDIDLSNYVANIEDNDDDVDFLGSVVTLNSNINLKLYFTSESSKVFTLDDFVVTDTNNQPVDADKLSIKKDKYGQYLMISDITAVNFDDGFNIKCNNVTVNNYSVLSYMETALKSDNENLAKLAAAIYDYNQKADNYK